MNKKNIILGGILVILIALVYFYQGPFKEWQSNLGKAKNFLAAIDINLINKIEIANNNQITTLEQKGENWKIVGTKDFYISDDLSNNLKSSLEKATQVNIELVSDNKDKKSEFQTDETSGIRVKLSQNEEIIADFIVGKRGVDFSSTYISEPESNKTYSLKTNINSLFDRSDWYDKTIFSSDKENINKIRFQYPNREFTIEKKDEDWVGTLPYSFEVDGDKISPILDIMSDLTATEIPEQTFVGTGLDKHSIIVQATGEEIDNTLMVGDAMAVSEEGGEEPYYAKRDDSDNIYLITKEQRDELDKNIQQFR